MASLLLLVASLATAADVNKEVIRTAVRAAVTPKPSPPAVSVPKPPQPQQQQPRHDDNSVPRTIATRVVANGKPSNSHRHDRYSPIYCTSFINCPFGSPGAPTFEELRVIYRDFTESELWNIGLGSRAAPFFIYGREGACMMLASPDPWRPVDLPLDESTLPPCEMNETLNRKRPQRACHPDLPED
jgi:hypothetical protein